MPEGGLAVVFPIYLKGPASEEEGLAQVELELQIPVEAEVEMLEQVGLVAQVLLLSVI
jgi:hypothetical protein